ncbi:uncharacterized protein LOC135585655 isoform X2 [Musa acuminata AAA Group]|uniref:uncharacterized protein LOC135585655 isoform X2 n=1 Tax=Musa acuminata AAA Group TaxID=214697 RepID=UPI0031DAB4A7
MINMFDLSAHMNGIKQLAENPHRDDLMAVGNHSDMLKKRVDSNAVQREGKHVTCEHRKSPSGKKSSGTPMKMLIAEEMCKETESLQKPPSVVARLMGLDSLPVQQAVLIDKCDIQEGYECNSLSGAQKRCQWKEDEYFEKMPWSLRSCTHEKKKNKDVYEACQQPARNSLVNDHISWNGKFDGNLYQRTTAFVRQKSTEAEHLATDDKFLKSKEFQDAIEVLSSNRDLFLRFLDEPKQICQFHNVPPPQKKCITVLKPSNVTRTKGDKVMENQSYEVSDENVGKTNKHYRSSSFSWSQGKPQMLSQPTRIVVLKPSPLRAHHIKTTLASPISSPEPSDAEGTCEALQTDEVVGSREIAKEITRCMRESFSSDRTDESLLSSLLSKRYFQDERSFNRSGSEDTVQEAVSFSERKVVSPTSLHSCDYPNVVCSPYSISSFSPASHSPESAVMREAKKRLSERLSLVTSTENSHEQLQEGRNSNSLGEMLAISEVKNIKELTFSGRRLSNEKFDMEVPSVSLSVDQTKDEYYDPNFPRNLSSSNSIAISSPVSETIELNVGASSSLVSAQCIQEEVPKLKGGKSSFKVKLSSLFFSRNRKQNRQKLDPPPLAVSDDRTQPGITKAGDKEVLSQSANDIFSAESNLVSPTKISANAYSSSLVYDGSDWVTPYVKDGQFLEKSSAFGNFSQPCPPSGLEAPFIGDVNNRLLQTIENSIVGHQQALSRSSPIESVARSISKEFSYLDTASNPLRYSIVLSKADEEYEQYVFVEKLIASAGLDCKKSSVNFTGWHSLESPLNPMLLELHMNGEEAKFRKRGSNKRLLFDSINAALLNISQKETLASYPWSQACDRNKDDSLSGPLAEEVWGTIKSWFSGHSYVTGEFNYSSNSVDWLVKKEMTGGQWVESMWSEMYDFSKEVGVVLLEELVEEALLEL